MASHKFGVFDGSLAQRRHNHAVAARSERVGVVVIHIVEKVVGRSAHIGHIAAKRLGRVGGEVHAVDVHSVVGGKQLVEVGSLIVLIAFAGHSGIFESL